jgi:glycosyl transferase family 25
MHIFVINLPEETDRLKAIELQLKKLGLAHEVFPAIRGRSLAREEKDRHYSETWYFRHEGRPASPGELGCALSHLAVYRLIRERNIPLALILEDDAWLNPNLPQLLHAIENKYNSEDNIILLLTWFISIFAGNFTTLWASYHVAEVSSALCAHGYVVSNAAATNLLDTLYPVQHVADCWGWLRRHRIVKVLTVFPPCITVNMSYESGITPVNEVKKFSSSAFERIVHKVYRAWWLGIDCSVAFLQRLGLIG